MKTCTKCKETKSKSEFCKKKCTKDGLHSSCKSCGKAWQQANKQQITVKKKDYYEANKERIAVRDKAYREANKEQIAVIKKAYYKINKETKSVIDKAYYKANKEQIAVIKKAWQQANPERVSIGRNKRRALKRNSEGIYTVSDITNLIQIQNSKCIYCKTDLITKGKGKYHVDHRVPLFLGGTNYPENLQLLCPTCNLSKGYKHPDIYEKQINHNQNKEL